MQFASNLFRLVIAVSVITGNLLTGGALLHPLLFRFPVMLHHPIFSEHFMIGGHCSCLWLVISSPYSALVLICSIFLLLTWLTDVWFIVCNVYHGSETFCVRRYSRRCIVWLVKHCWYNWFFKPPPPVGAGGGYMFSGRPSVRASVRPWFTW